MKLTRSEAKQKLEPAVVRVSAALRKLATAASGHFGCDCFLHMEMGCALLADLGISAHPVVGFAAWRVGTGDGDVISHAPFSQGYSLPSGKGLVYHAWLNWKGFLVDFTTYQFRHKARQLDALDGGCTTVTWCPEYLLLRWKDVLSYGEVTASMRPGVAYYQARSELEPLLRSRGVPDPTDLYAARVLLANPHLTISGPNDAGDVDETP
jgi:hypothetical protein